MKLFLGGRKFSWNISSKKISDAREQTTFMKADVTTLCVVTSAFICGLRKNSFIYRMKKFLLNALTMSLKTKKVPKYFFWKLQIVFVELYNHYWPWNKSGEEVEYSIRFARRSGKLEMLRGQNHKKKEESVFEEVGADTKNSKRRA